MINLFLLVVINIQQQKQLKPSPKKRKGHFFKLRFGSGRKISAPTGLKMFYLFFFILFAPIEY